MTRDKPRHSGSAIIIAVAGLSGMAIGWAIGTLSPPTDTVSTVSPAADHELAALVRNLTTELHGLQTNHELMDAHISQELERLRVAIRATPPTRLVGEQAQTEEDAPDMETPTWATEMLHRLNSLQQLQRQALSLSQAARIPEPDWAIPEGVAIRDYLSALHERAAEDDAVTTAHTFWTEQKIASTYGLPDRVEDRGGYIEWIYVLDEGQQFDFHLVNGLCVMAH